jgi:hypothetical protein
MGFKKPMKVQKANWVTFFVIVLSSDGKGLCQQARQEEWKKCKKKEE